MCWEGKGIFGHWSFQVPSPPIHFHLVISAGLPDLCHPPPWVPPVTCCSHSHLRHFHAHTCTHTLSMFVISHSHTPAPSTHANTHTHTFSPPEACGPSAVDQVIPSILLSWTSAVSCELGLAIHSLGGGGGPVLWLFPPGELGKRWERAELGI